MPVLPPSADMFEPRPEYHLAAHEQLEEFIKCALVAVMAAVKVIVGNRHISPVPRDIDVVARTFWNLVVGQVGLENSRRWPLFITAIPFRRMFEPGTVLGN